MWICFAMSLFAMGKLTEDRPLLTKDEIRILPVKPTPESNTVELIIVIPEEGELQKGNPVWTQLRMDGYTLGAASQFDRSDEVAVSKKGQTVHVIVDNYPAFSVDEPAMDPFTEDGWYYDRTFKFRIPYHLKEGVHTLRMFPVRSYGESLKGENTYQSTYFYVGEKKGDLQKWLKEPYLTYNEPSDRIPLTENQPVLLDFYITNTELTEDGYRVLLTVDGKLKRTLTAWQPYYIYGLKAGKHTIRLQLINRRGKVVEGPFNDVERTIYIQY